MSRNLDSRVFIPVAVKRIAVIVGRLSTVRWDTWLGDFDEEFHGVDVLNSNYITALVLDTKWVGKFP